MKTMPDWLIMVCRWVLIIGIPLALTLTNVRLLMTHTFPEIEYNLPGFRDDFYGFTKDDRLYWSKRSIDYIMSNPSAGNAEDWKFSDEGRAPEGWVAPAPETCADYGNQFGPRDCTYFYNDREVQHLLDVRNVTTGALNVWALAGILSLIAIGLLTYFNQTTALRAGLLGGSALTWGILIFLVAFIGLGFNTFFELFHRTFFAEGTYTFYWSDSLIRLFPLTFWFHAFLFVGLATLLQAAIVAAVAWWGVK